MFAGMTFTIFDAVANINNRINSNNNNNNNQNINFQQSVNTVVTGNINVANQVKLVSKLFQHFPLSLVKCSFRKDQRYERGRKT